MGAHRVYDSVNSPEEHARVPEELPTLKEKVCQLLIRLLSERLHAREILIYLFIFLNVAIARFWAVGLNTKCHDGIILFKKLKCPDHAVLEVGMLEDEMIARGNHYFGVGIKGLNVPCCPCVAGSGIAAHWLKQYLFGLYLRQLLLDYFGILLIGEHYDVLYGNYALKTVNGKLQQAASCS